MSGRISRAAQDKAVKNFQSVTGASTKQAVAELKRTNWKVDVAVEHWFSEGKVPDSGSTRRVDPAKVEALFAQYKDEDGDYISIGGVLSLAGDLGLEMTDLQTTILLCLMNFLKLQSKHVNFVQGMTELGADTVADLKSALAKAEAKYASDPDFFKRVYLYAYDGNLEPGKRALRTEHAVSMLPVLLGSRWQLLGDFVDFLGASGEEFLSKDTWKTLIPFMKTVPNTASLASYEDDGCWPVLLDEFVTAKVSGSGPAAAGGSGGAAK